MRRQGKSERVAESKGGFRHRAAKKIELYRARKVAPTAAAHLMFLPRVAYIKAVDLGVACIKV
jgi:hypothetical protein